MVAGFGHSMVLTQDGVVWATGWNLYDKFDDGSITSTNVFVEVVKLQEFSEDVVHDALKLTEDWFPPDLPVLTGGSNTGDKHVITYICIVRSMHISWLYYSFKTNHSIILSL